MLKRISDYIPGFNEIYYINEFGDVYQTMKAEDLSNGSYTWRCCGVSYSRLVREFLRHQGRYSEITPTNTYKRSSDLDVSIVDCGQIYRIYGCGKECLYLKEHNCFLALRKKKPQKNGYKYLGTQPNRFSIHILVYLLFVGDIEDGNCIHHLDFSKSFNWYKNLRQVTKSEHALIHDNLNH